MTIVRITIANTIVRCTAEQAGILAILTDAKAGFATFHNYTSETGYVTGKPKVSTVTVNAKVSASTVYANRLAALEGITMDDCDLTDWVASKGKNAFDNAAEQFAFCKAAMIESAKGNGSASHKAAHEDHSLTPAKGVKVWLNDDSDADSVRSVKSVLVNALPVSETVHDKGERKTVNSGSKVLMDSAITKVWNRRACNIRTYNPFKAEKVTISGAVIG